MVGAGLKEARTGIRQKSATQEGGVVEGKGEGAGCDILLEVG